MHTFLHAKCITYYTYPERKEVVRIESRKVIMLYYKNRGRLAVTGGRDPSQLEYIWQCFSIW
jgi:hypothetical protein